MLRVADRRGAVRRLYRERHPASSAREIAFTVYAGIAVVLCAVFPVARALVLVLADSAAVGAIAGSRSALWLGVAACVALAALVVVGALRGPATTRPVFVWTIASNDLPRRTALLPPFLRAGTILSLLVGSIASLAGAALLIAGRWSPLDLAVFVAGCLLFGMLGAMMWLLGQFAGSSRAWLAATGVLALGVLSAWAPVLLHLTPWGWLIQLSRAPAAASLWLAALLPTAAGCLLLAPLLLDRLSGTALMAQAMRWESATMAGVSGDLTLSLALFRALPRLGRNWHAVVSGNRWAVYWWRGLIGAFRTPVRMLSGMAGLALGNTLVALSPVAPPAVAAVGGAAGALLTFLSLGPLSDGLRHAAEAAAAPALYGYRSSTLVPLMLVFPASIEAVLAALPAAAVVAFAGLPLAPIASGSVAVIAVLSRVLHSAKGPLPPLLLTPIPTPFGDLSGLVVLVWQGDALLITALTGTVAAAALASGSVGLASGSTAVIAGAVTWLAIRRYRRR